MQKQRKAQKKMEKEAKKAKKMEMKADTEIEAMDSSDEMHMDDSDSESGSDGDAGGSMDDDGITAEQLIAQGKQLLERGRALQEAMQSTGKLQPEGADDEDGAMGNVDIDGSEDGGDDGGLGMDGDQAEALLKMLFTKDADGGSKDKKKKSKGKK